MKRNEVLASATVRMILENIRISARSQMQRTAYDVVPLI